MTLSARLYADFQSANPEHDFNDDLITWRESDDPLGYLEDVFQALEIVPGITFRGIYIERDESRHPPELTYNDIEPSRLDLARIRLHLALGDEEEEVTLSIFLPKLIDGLFYFLNGSLFYPILQLVDRGTYVTRKTLTLKTLLMPLVFRRDSQAAVADTGLARGEGGCPETTELLFVLDLFRSRINVMKYMMAEMGLGGTMDFLGVRVAPEALGEGGIIVVDAADAAAAVADSGPGVYRVHDVRGANGKVAQAKVAGGGHEASGLVVMASAAWVAGEPAYRGSLMATLADALEGASRQAVAADETEQWKRRLGRHFTQNSNGYVEKAEKILVSLRRILDNRTRRNLVHLRAGDKETVFTILRWMMRDFRQLTQVDGMSVVNKRIRVAEYLIHPLLLRFSESTYRLLNSKSLTFKGLRGVFKPFMQEADGRQRPLANFLIRKLASNDLLRYLNMVNSFDLLTSLRWTSRGPQSMGERGRGDISLRFRGHHPSYVGRIGLAAASASDPGTSGTLVPFCPTSSQFFLEFKNEEKRDSPP